MPLDAGRMAQIKQGLSAIMSYAGETATWRQYVSASAGLAEYGLGSSNYYVTRLITGVFNPVKPQEVWQAGGQLMAGDVWVTTFLPLNQRDEINWGGSRYMSISDPKDVTLFGTAASQTVLRRA